MAISTPGLGSGLDVNGIVSQLVQLERKPIAQLESQKSSLETKLSQWGQISSRLSTLRDAVQALKDPALWDAKAVTVSGSGVTATATANAAAGQYEVQVNQLAAAQKLSSDNTYGTGALGWSGSLQITKGTWAGGNFTPGGGSPATVTIAATDTLATIAQKINQANAGVSASVVNTGSGLKLAIRGLNTGEDNGFAIRAYDGSNNEITDGTGLGGLTYATGITNGMGGTLASNASIQIDGITVTSSTNTISNAISGVTFNLAATNTAPVTVSVGTDNAKLRDAIKAFQTAYNEVASFLRSATRADTSGSGNNGPLVGDQAALGIQRALRDLVGSNGPGGLPWSRLSDVGLQLQRDGTLSLNAAKLDSALASPTQLGTFFDDASDGLATRMQTRLNQWLAFDGTVKSRSQNLQNGIERRNDDIARQEARIERIEKQLLKQYSALDATLSGLNGLSSYITQQISQWNKSAR